MNIYRLLLWLGLAIGIGLVFTIGWAVIFWNNDNLYMWHWLAVPMSMIIMAIGGAVEMRKL